MYVLLLQLNVKASSSCVGQDVNAPKRQLHLLSGTIASRQHVNVG